jgi:septal ring factor EnvC (AmiA/AmiB activator)
MAYDDEDLQGFSAGQRQGGGVLPWILLTAVVVIAAVAMFAFDTQKEQAVGQAKKAREELDSTRKRQSSLDAQVQDLQKQVTALTAEKTDIERQKNEATLKADDLGQQLALARKGGADEKPGKGKKAKSKKGSRRHR